MRRGDYALSIGHEYTFRSFIRPPAETGFGIFRRVRYALACRTGPVTYLYADLNLMSTG
jgi:hypothetical protein